MGKFNPRKLTVAQAREILIKVRRGQKPDSIAVEYNVSRELVSQIKNGKVWKGLADEIARGD